jgi:arylsulfatase A-like enzyme
MKNLSRRSFITTVVGGSLAYKSVGKTKLKKDNPPNVIYIMADDLGWGDLSCYGRREYNTPNLDWLASKGVKFTNAYSAGAVSTPTRCAFMTGKYPGRTPVGLMEPLPFKKGNSNLIGLEPSLPTIASILKANNYQTVLIGKWHLGYMPEYSPIKSGFTDFFGYMSGGIDYFTHTDRLIQPDFFENETPVEKPGYTTNLFTDKAVEFISGIHEKPFFLSLNYNAPHWPWEGPEDSSSKSWNMNGSTEIYKSMMESLDSGIGKVLSAVKKNNLEDNTLIIFTSDNGGERYSYNWPFSGIKASLKEGGIRVPAIVYLKGVVPVNKIINQMSITMDWTKTILNFCKINENTYHEMDGIDLLPIIKGEKSEIERTLFWRTRTQGAVRKGHWKYHKSKTAESDIEVLSDLDFDNMEKSEFKDLQPEIFLKLKEEYSNWDKEMLEY